MLAIYRYAVSSRNLTRHRWRYCVAESIDDAQAIAEQRESGSVFSVVGRFDLLCSLADFVTKNQTKQLTSNRNLLDKLPPADKRTLLEALRFHREAVLKAKAKPSTDSEPIEERRPITGVEAAHALGKLPGRSGIDYAQKLNAMLGRE